MSIKMVDMQVLIPKVQEVARTQQIQQQGSNNQQASTANQLVREAEQRQNSVQETPRNEEGKIREREGDQGSKRETDAKKKQRKEESQSDEAGLAKDPRLGKRIDITV